jgi:hypothetical protein
MLVPTLSQMLVVIAVALAVTAVLTGLTGLLLIRGRATAKPTPLLARIPAPREGQRRTPVASR